MTYIRNKEVVFSILQLKECQAKIDKMTQDAKYWDDMTMEERAQLVYKYKTSMLRKENLDFQATYYSFKQTNVDTYEIFTGSIGKKPSLTHVKSNRVLYQSSEPSESITLDIDLNQIDAFRNMKAQWLYFKLQNVEIEFRNNSKASFIPVICHYLPPCYELVYHSTSLVNNAVVASGTSAEVKTIADPCYIVRMVEPGKDLDPDADNYHKAVREITYPVSGLQKDMYVANYNLEKMYLDYGKFVFETKNLDNVQDIIITAKFNFNFYTYANPEDFYNAGED